MARGNDIELDLEIHPVDSGDSVLILDNGDGTNNDSLVTLDDTADVQRWNQRELRIDAEKAQVRVKFT